MTLLIGPQTHDLPACSVVLQPLRYRVSAGNEEGLLTMATCNHGRRESNAEKQGAGPMQGEAVSWP
jgi:hypothetical protein